MATSSSKPSIPGIAFVREVGGISEYLLKSNGLRILLCPSNALVAGFMVTYHVGSRNEAIGYTGATHLLEHLMFKGSENFNKQTGGTIWQILETKGALVNATTWTDRTNYYEVIPKEHLPTAIALEADRMRRAHLREADRQSEMTVVRNEFEQGENNPMEALDKQIWALAYEAHPYHHSTIGWRSDIEQVPIERLRKFYDDFYWPDNATVSLVGGFDTPHALKLIKKEFGTHEKRSGAYPRMYTEEPAQEGERRAVVKRAGNTDMLALAYKTPKAIHEDIPALLVLSSVLTGGKTSRLYRALIDSAKATGVSSTCHEFQDPSLLITYITLAPTIAHAEIESIVKAEYQKIIEKGITAAELARAKRAMRAYTAAKRDGPYAFLAALNEEIATGDWTRFVTQSKEVDSVTSRAVQEVAKKYLNDDRSTVAWFKAIPPNTAQVKRTNVKRTKS